MDVHLKSVMSFLRSSSYLLFSVDLTTFSKINVSTFSFSLFVFQTFFLYRFYCFGLHLHTFFFNVGEKWHSLLPGFHLILKVYFRFSALCCLLILLTDFVCLYNYEFWLSLCKIVRSSVILLLPLLSTVVTTIRINFRR